MYTAWCFPCYFEVTLRVWNNEILRHHWPQLVHEVYVWFNFLWKQFTVDMVMKQTKIEIYLTISNEKKKKLSISTLTWTLYHLPTKTILVSTAQWRKYWGELSETRIKKLQTQDDWTFSCLEEKRTCKESCGWLVVFLHSRTTENSWTKHWQKISADDHQGTSKQLC